MSMSIKNGGVSISCIDIVLQEQLGESSITNKIDSIEPQFISILF